MPIETFSSALAYMQQKCEGSAMCVSDIHMESPIKPNRAFAPVLTGWTCHKAKPLPLGGGGDCFSFYQ